MCYGGISGELKANNYKLVCTDKRKEVQKEYEYYFETIEDAIRAKRAIEKGGNKAEVKRIK